VIEEGEDLATAQLVELPGSERAALDLDVEHVGTRSAFVLSVRSERGWSRSQRSK
jgi:hypothetical protein